jgi:hypothetical protein
MNRQHDDTSSVIDAEQNDGYGFYGLGRSVAPLAETEFSDRLYSFAFVLNNERLPPGKIHLRATSIYNRSAQLNLQPVCPIKFTTSLPN